MNLFDITLWNGSKKIRQLDWPKDQYFECVEFHCPECVDGWLHWQGKKSPYTFYFGGKSQWEIAE